MKIKVKFVNRGIGMFRGGGEIFALNIANGLKHLGCEVSFITGKPLFKQVKYPIEEFKTDYVTSPYLRDFSQKLGDLPFPVSHIGYGLLYFDLWAFSKKVMELLKKQDSCDIVQTCGLPGLASEIVKNLKIPVVICFPGPPAKRQKREIEKCSAVIANGDAVKRLKNMISQNIFDIPPGVDTNTFKPTVNKVRDKYKLQHNKLLLFVGRFVPLKNLPFLLKTFAEIAKKDNKVRLMMVGEGPLDGKIKRLSRKLKVSERIIFTGKIANEELPQYYSAADIFVMSSIYDNFPNSILEAMSCELPVVAPRVGGIPMQIKDGVNGFLVESGNVEQFKKKIIFLLDNESLAKEIGKRNRQEVKEKYSWLESAKKFKAIYDSLL